MAESTDEFAADAGKRLKEELSQVAESDGILASDAPLREEAKDLGKGGVNGGGGGEIGAEGFDLGVLERRLRGAFGAVRGCAFGSMVNAERCAVHSALAAIGKGKAATVGRGPRRGRWLGFVAIRNHPAGMVRSRVQRGRHGRRFQIGNVRFERKKGRRKIGAGEWFLYGSHMKCYRYSKLASIG